jgi:hypothetical protein
VTASGRTRYAPIFYAAPGQVNYLVPSGTAVGRGIGAGGKRSRNGRRRNDRRSTGRTCASSPPTPMAVTFRPVSRSGSGGTVHRLRSRSMHMTAP